jgi:hypothetical protein
MLYPPASHLRMDNGPEFIASALQGGVPESVAARLTSRQVDPRRIHLWSHSTAGSVMSS